MSNKVCTLQEAVAKYVEDGDSISFGGFTTNKKPMAAVREILRQGKKDFIAWAGPAGSDWDMLIGEDRVKAYINCYTADSGVTNVSRRFRKKIEAGELIYEDYSQDAIMYMLHASSLGLPFLPVRFMIGSGLVDEWGITKEVRETIDKLLYNGYSTISLGYAGLYECVKYMTGKSHTDPSATPFALAIMQKMNDKCKEWKTAENIDYSLYGTPLESTTYKFAKCLQKRFGVIKGITDKGYITNSYHVNVTEEIDAFTKLEFEAQFQHLSPGGAISYVEVPDMQNNIPAVLEVMKFIYDHIIYAELNTKSDYCQECGYTGEIQIVEEKAHSQVRDICVQVKAVLESITPELASDIMNQGIYVSGGGAAFPKTAEWIKEEFKIPVHIADRPEDHVILGMQSYLKR